MKFVDEITLTAHAGRGGDGVERWHTSRRQQKGGPAGGNGGRGGDVVVRAVRDLGLLGKYRGNTHFRAQDGKAGGKSSLYGSDGAPVVIDLPVGSVVTVRNAHASPRVSSASSEGGNTNRNQQNETQQTHAPKAEHTIELLSEGQEYVVLRGGAGGYGNEHFKSSRNTAPKQTTPGKDGEHGTLEVELKVIADVGLVGLPNAGKTSLLNALTNAKGKVGNYAFTTLDPNLGELYGYIIADIPGLIEGAAGGKGLGHKFLKHISRTKTLIFCISVEQEDPKSTLKTLFAELNAYDPQLLSVPRIILLTKSDLVDSKILSSLVADFSDVAPVVASISIFDQASVKAFSNTLTQMLSA